MDSSEVNCIVPLFLFVNGTVVGKDRVVGVLVDSSSTIMMAPQKSDLVGMITLNLVLSMNKKEDFEYCREIKTTGR